MTGDINNSRSLTERLTAIITANLTNDQFGVTELARAAGMSRSNIHRHLKKQTNQSISHFIRNVRLDKAMEMLQETDDTSAEVAYNVGFGSPAYFTHRFR
jgi:AraC-like DNA-binding protein